MLYYPNVQARYYLHRFCYNAKVNYWMRVRREASPFTSTNFEPIGDCGAVFNLYDA